MLGIITTALTWFWGFITRMIPGLVISFGAKSVFEILFALGIGWVSFQGLDTLVNAAIVSVNNAYLGIPPDVIDLLNLAGFGTAISIITSALLARLSIIITKKLSSLA